MLFTEFHIVLLFCVSDMTMCVCICVCVCVCVYLFCVVGLYLTFYV